MMTVEGATDAEVFETFLERVLLRKLKPGDIVVLDNVAAHKADEVRLLPPVPEGSISTEITGGRVPTLAGYLGDARAARARMLCLPFCW